MDISGNKYGRWTVLRLARTEANRKSFYDCRCECGTERPVRKDQLTRGISYSCGCYKREVSAEQIKRLSITHGLSKTRTYQIWKGMRKRCINPAEQSWAKYGGRGISVCKRWDKFENFLADMGEAPKKFSIDRIDVNGDYKLSNCRWADAKQQANNTRTNLLVRYAGKEMTLKQWAEELGIPYHRLYQRILRLSWPIERAFSESKKINQFG